jgi:2-C-methyl-D-erythritol 2,4-cyclodiphosphate synthase
MLKIGLGYDIHKLIPGKKLILGGVELPGDFGPLSHSDGDALVHALIDSLLSPLGAGDIGTLFPDTDAKWKDSDSTEILKSVKQNYLANIKIQNIDCIVILDKPKISPFIKEMKDRLSACLGISETQIGIKGKTSENTKVNSVECYVVSLMEII